VTVALTFHVYGDAFATVTNTDPVIRDGQERSFVIDYADGVTGADILAADGSGVVWFDDMGRLGHLKAPDGSDMRTVDLIAAVDAASTYSARWVETTADHPDLMLTAIIPAAVPEVPAPAAPPVRGPAPLLAPGTAYDMAIQTIAGRVAAELNVADASETEPFVLAAADLVAVELDRPEPYATPEVLPPAVVLAVVTVACDLYRRGGLAFGVIGVGESGQPITTGRDPLAAVRGMLRPYRRRWGFA
jgi:hypothetical protein